MNNKNPFSQSENQCELSYELLYLLKWLVENETQSLKKIITRAVNNGFTPHHIDDEQMFTPTQPEVVQHSIVEFLDLLDTLLLDALNEKSVKKALQSNIMPSIDKIDSNICDKDTVQTSLERATAKLERQPEANLKELLYKELLKRWKPQKKKSQH